MAAHSIIKAIPIKHIINYVDHNSQHILITKSSKANPMLNSNARLTKHESKDKIGQFLTSILVKKEQTRNSSKFDN